MSDKPLKVPVMDHLDDLSEDELKFYYEHWSVHLTAQKRIYETAVENYSKVAEEVARRYYVNIK